MNKRIKRMIMGSVIVGAITGVAAVFSHMATKKLIGIALDRADPKEMEKSKKKIAGSSQEMQEIFEMQRVASEELKKLDLEIIEIEAADSTKLIGHLYRCNDAKRTIVAMHGWRSTWDLDFGIITPFWLENKCNVLFAEQRGQGESGGDYMGFGLTERHDCLDWVNWLNNNGFDNLPIYLCGISMGATTVLMASGLDLPDNVHGISADCGFTSPHAIWKHVAEKNLHIPYNRVIAAIVGDICKKKIQMGPNDYSCTEALKYCKVPVLFIHGTDDHFVPIEMTYENYKACVSEKRLFVVPGAEHGLSYLVNREAYEQVAKQFWADFD